MIFKSAGFENSTNGATVSGKQRQSWVLTAEQYASIGMPDLMLTQRRGRASVIVFWNPLHRRSESFTRSIGTAE